MQEIPQNHKRK